MPENYVLILDFAGKIAGACVPVVAGAIYKLVTLHGRVATLEEALRERKIQAADMLTQQAVHESRLAVLERLMAKMELLPETLQEFSRLSTRLEALVGASERRLEILEDRIYHRSQE